jgi:hypothetical protein
MKADEAAALTPANWLKARQAAAKSKSDGRHRGHSVRNDHRHAPAPRAGSSGALAPALEDGHPGRLGRRASSLPESHPHRQPPPIQIPSPTPTRRKGGGAFPSCPQPQRMPPPEPDDQGKVNGRVVCVLRVICDDVRQRADSLSASQTPDLRPNSLPKC